MPIDSDLSWSLEKFGVGQPVPRKEDPVLLRGEGRYTDDLNLPDQLHGVIVRSPHAHGVLNGVDVTQALAVPGVVAVYTGADLTAAGFGTLKCVIPFPNRDGTPMVKPPRPPFAVDKVRFVGDPVAIVVAETLAAAKDGAEAVALDIDPLPAVTEAREAVKPGAPQLYEEAPGNVALDYHYGDAAATEAAFARAAHVTRLRLRNTRVVVSPLEPRSAIASYDAAADRYTVNIGCQGVMGLRGQIATDLLGVPVEKVRILTGNVGGSFGMKAGAYPEYAGILHAAKLLGRPVKWTDERSGSFLSDSHGRDHDIDGELALDAEGRFLAVRLTGYANMGAYLGTVAPLMGSLNLVKNVVSVYRTPLVEVATKCCFTNTTLVSAYRGAGRPEGNYFMERLIDTAAREMGIDRAELRRRNHIAAAEMPYKAPSGLVYDSGDFPAVFEEALKVADWAGFEARRLDSAKRGLLRGIGISDFLESTAPPSKEMGGLRFETDGTVTILTGTLDYGQGHAGVFAQVLVQRLGVPFDRVRLLQGDSDQLIAGGGTGGSRSAMASGGAVVAAADKVIEIGRKLSAQALEAAEEDISFAAGRFSIAGTDRGIGVLELAERLRQGMKVPDGLPTTLDVSLVHEFPAATFPNGCHIVEVEIDPETGVTRIDRYMTVNDFGTILNPMIVEGQLHGGIAQGVGQALMEHVVYDEEGQLLSGSYMDYALPRAGDLPMFGFHSHPVPASTNALGVKGCGEAGCAGSFPAVMNAVVDALSPLGIKHLDMPATPHRVWRAIQEANGA